jgi:hypothetical protein
MNKFLAAAIFSLFGIGAASAQLTNITPSGGGGSATPGGSSGQIQWNNASALGGVSGWTTNGSTTLTGGSTSILATGDGSKTAPSMTFGSSSTIGFFTRAGYVMLAGSAGERFQFSSIGGLNMGATIGLSNNNDLSVSGPDLFLNRDAANTLALRNGTNAQTFNVYNTYTDASNYEDANLSWQGNVFYLSTYKLGTGVARDIAIQPNSGSNLGWTFKTTGHLFAGVDNIYDIGASAANRPRNVYVGSNITLTGNINNSSSSGSVFYTYSTLDYMGQLVGFSGTIGLFPNGKSSIVATQTLVAFGGGATGSINTSSFPALKRSTTTLQARLADDSAFTAIQGKLTTDTAYTAGTTTAAGYITLYDSTGTAYKVNACTAC